MIIKYKHYGRAHGVLFAGLGAYICNTAYSVFPSSISSFSDFAVTISGATFMAMGSFVISDGIADVVKGTHHYIGNRLCKALLSKDEEDKKRWDSSLEEMLSGEMIINTKSVKSMPIEIIRDMWKDYASKKK